MSAYGPLAASYDRLTRDVPYGEILAFAQMLLTERGLKPRSVLDLACGTGATATAVAAVLNGIMPSYLTGFIYSALIDSFCSEQNARMTAMDAANKNAEELLSQLSLQYNRVRQAAITQEITEISAGAKAQKKKREKGASVR